MQMNPGALRIGAEAAYLSVEADSDVIGAERFNVLSVGPVLLWQTGRGVNLGFAVGRRFMDSEATYFRIDFALFPMD